MSLLQTARDLLGMLLVALKNLQAGLQKALQLRVTGRRNQLRLKRAVDSLVVGDLVGDISLVERRATQLAEFGELVSGLLGQRLTGVVVFRRHVELLNQIERLLVYRFMVTDHVFRKRLDLLVAGFGQSLLAGRDIDHACGVRNMRDLRIGELGPPVRGHSKASSRQSPRSIERTC